MERYSEVLQRLLTTKVPDPNALRRPKASDKASIRGQHPKKSERQGWRIHRKERYFEKK